MEIGSLSALACSFVTWCKLKSSVCVWGGKIQGVRGEAFGLCNSSRWGAWWRVLAENYSCECRWQIRLGEGMRERGGGVAKARSAYT